MSSSSVEQCALRADSMHEVHHAIVEVNVVIGVLVVQCELLVVRVVPVVVCDDAVVRRTLSVTIGSLRCSSQSANLVSFLPLILSARVRS